MFADCLVILSKTETELRNMMNRIVEVERRCGIDKSKVMRVSKEDELQKITVEFRKLRDVGYNFKYLGIILLNRLFIHNSSISVYSNLLHIVCFI